MNVDALERAAFTPRLHRACRTLPAWQVFNGAASRPTTDFRASEIRDIFALSTYDQEESDE
jgi:hypothetical protein